MIYSYAYYPNLAFNFIIWKKTDISIILHNIDFHNKKVSYYEWKLIKEDVELCYDTL